MKRIFTLMTACCLVMAVCATDRYVAVNGDDANEGSSWTTAYATIQTAISKSSVGDNVLVGAGVYNQAIAIKDGVNVLGGYNPATGERDIDAFKTILDGTGLNKYLIVKYDNDCANPTLIEGLTLQNAEHTNDGGGAYIRGNMTLNLCTITNCKGKNGGGVFLRSKDASLLAVAKNCIIELCSATSSAGGAYVYQNALLENCIIRGCGGKYGGAIRNAGGDDYTNCVVRNCVLHNNAATVDGWPDSGGIYNGILAEVYNITSCNNYGAKYAGIHSYGKVYNSVFWGNVNEEGFDQPANYIGSDSHSSDNWADEGFDGSSFTTIKMSKNNTDAQGPNFKNPCPFVGIPKNAGEIAVMRNADYSLTSASPFINKAKATYAPAYDIEGNARPIGSASDIGAYEFDPNAPVIAVTGVRIAVDTLFIYEEAIDGLAAIVEPKKASNKSVTWLIADTKVATIDNNGAVTGVKEGKTVATVKTVDGGFTATAVVVVNPKPPVFYPNEVLAADTLYPIENYTIPSYIPFWVAREAARLDSLTVDHALIATRLKEMNDAINNLVPKEEPYNMIANINGDPSTRMAFTWFTNEGITEGKVQYCEGNIPEADFVDENPNIVTIDATATTTKPLRYAVSTSGLIKATGMDTKTAFKYESHKAIAENLKPGSEYTWRVGYPGHWSETAHFRTKDEVEGEYSFVYMSDSHIMDAEYVENARICSKAVAKNAADARFCVFPGDFVETGTNANSEWEWERWFEESIKPVIMQMPIVPTDGNHDDTDNLNYNYHFNTDNAFNKQAKTKPQFDGITYSFVYGDVLFLVYSLQDWWRASGSSAEKMKSTYLSSDVKNWFKEQVAAHPNTKYRVTLAHKNIFSGSGHSVDDETPMFREIMLPIFKECEIDLALQGHDHCYEVIGPVNWDTRRVVENAVSDVETSESLYDSNKNKTSKKGGTFCTDDGTLFFIGATCGRKRYYPYDRETMDANYSKHKVTDYFDLFTSMFGQPDAPSFTKITVKESGLELNSYTANEAGGASLYNTIKVVRNKPHSIPSGFEDVSGAPVIKEGKKFVKDGQIYIRFNEHTYNMFGMRME